MIRALLDGSESACSASRQEDPRDPGPSSRGDPRDPRPV